MRYMTSSTRQPTYKTTNTTMQQNKTMIHVYPIEDSGHKHTLTTKCACIPTTTEHNKAVTVDHRMVGTGPDSWTVDVVDNQDK